jgi:putative lipoic acid-binding regulatory protein
VGKGGACLQGTHYSFTKMINETSLLEFPCDFQIKIIGKNHPLFLSEILSLAKKHYPYLDTNQLKTNPSQNGNYIALTLSVHALDKQTLDALYIDLSNHPDAKMVL